MVKAPAQWDLRLLLECHKCPVSIIEGFVGMLFDLRRMHLSIDWTTDVGYR